MNTSEIAERSAVSDADDLRHFTARVIFEPGTGKPKGVMVDQDGNIVLDLVSHKEIYFDLAEFDERRAGGKEFIRALGLLPYKD